MKKKYLACIQYIKLKIKQLKCTNLEINNKKIYLVDEGKRGEREREGKRSRGWGGGGARERGRGGLFFF